MIGRSIRRREDRRLLTGDGRFTDDLDPPGVLHAAMVRSSAAHARLVGVETSEAVAMRGVAGVLLASDLDESGVGELPVTWVHPGQRGTTIPLLASDKAYYVGQPIAVVLADNAYIAEDASERVRVAYKHLPTVMDADAALAPDAPILHEDWGTNELVTAVVEGGDVDAAFAGADVILSRRYRIQRQAGAPLEPRAALASHDPVADQIILHASLQTPHYARTVICRVCGWPEHRLRVIAPDVGGGFGVKDHPYAEEVVVCSLAHRFGRPIKWIEDRREHFFATVHSREQIWDIELGASPSGEVLGVRGRVIYDIGGHSSNHGIGPARVSADMLLGPYAVANYRMAVVGAITNKVPIGAYRGFGSPQSTFVMERLMDELARHVDCDRGEIRKLNMIGRDDLPYSTPAGFTYDSGDYRTALDRALATIDYEGFQKRREASRRTRCHQGIGIASFVQPAGLAPSRVVGEAGLTYGAYETVLVRMDPSGRVTVFVPSPSQGQGHATTLAQVCADRLGLDPQHDVVVVQGDTGVTPYSAAGTIASRVASIAGAGVLLASERIRARLCQLAAHVLEASEADIDLTDGAAVVRGSPSKRVQIHDLAGHAHTGHDLPDDVDPGLEERETIDPSASTFPYGTHAAVVEVDPDTGAVRILRYVVVSDCGVLLNPTIVEGQIRGGVAQGIGGAMLEKLAYDDAGQLLTASFMDYLLPVAPDIPSIEIEHLEIPAPDIPGGAKGAGEAGTIAPAAVLASAVSDALGIEVDELPLDSEAVWQLWRARRANVAATEGSRRAASHVS
jgi:carbon-monoxide dehydrogenase large subunit